MANQDKEMKMLRIKRALLASIIGLCSIQPIYAAGLTIIDAPAELKISESVIFTDGEVINLGEMREKYKDSPSTLAYIDTLKPGIHANNTMLSIIDLNLTAARNADLESSAEGRSATVADIERHKEYILKSQASRGDIEKSHEDQSFDNSSGHATLSNSLNNINDQFGTMQNIITSTLPVILVIGGCFFLFRAASRR